MVVAKKKKKKIWKSHIFAALTALTQSMCFCNWLCLNMFSFVLPFSSQWLKNYNTGCNLVETANITIPCYIWCSKVKSFVCEMVKSLNRYIYFWSLLNVIIVFSLSWERHWKIQNKQSGFSFIVKRTSFIRSLHLFLKISLIF